MIVLALVRCKIYRISVNENTYSFNFFKAVVASNAGAFMKPPEPVTHRQTANKTNQILDGEFGRAHGVGN